MKLTDFGIGQVVSEEYLVGITRAGFTQTMLSSSSTQTGTQLYMAPELLAGTPATTRSDIYSLGVVLYQLLIGDFKRPVTGDWAEEIHDPLLRDDLKHCLAGKAEDRFAGAAQLAKSLLALSERQAELARQEAERLERARLRQEAERRRRLVVISTGVAAGLVVLAMALGYGLRKAQRAQRGEERESYYALIGLAQSLVEQGEIDQAKEALLKCPARFRHWEWGHLLFRCYQDVLSIPAHTEAKFDWKLRETSPTGQPPKVIFSHDGFQLASLGRDGSVKVWDATDGHRLFALGGTNRPATAVAFNPSLHQVGVICIKSGSQQFKQVGVTSHNSTIQVASQVGVTSHNSTIQALVSFAPSPCGLVPSAVRTV